MKKRKIIESVIFLTIIFAIIMVVFIAYNILNTKPEISNTNNLKNYSVTKYTTYKNNIENILKYNIPLQENIDYESSSYNIYLISTDNIITTLNEEIIIKYREIPNETKNIVTNFCNAYDEIENIYRLQCKLENFSIKLSNSFYISLLTTNIIETKNYKLELPIKKDTKLNEYLNILKNNNIIYYEVENLP